MLRLEDSHVIGPEADASDEVVWAGFGEELVAEVRSRSINGGAETLARLPSKTMS